MVKSWKRAAEIHRGTVGARASINFVTDLGIDVARPVHVIANEQIKLAVVVVIEESGGGAPIFGRAAHTCLEGDLAEFSLAFIVKQMTTTDSGHENIVDAVIVVVPNCHAHAITTPIQA